MASHARSLSRKVWEVVAPDDSHVRDCEIRRPRDSNRFHLQRRGARDQAEAALPEGAAGEGRVSPYLLTKKPAPL